MMTRRTGGAGGAAGFCRCFCRLQWRAAAAGCRQPARLRQGAAGASYGGRSCCGGSRGAAATARLRPRRRGSCDGDGRGGWWRRSDARRTCDHRADGRLAGDRRGRGRQRRCSPAGEAAERCGAAREPAAGVRSRAAADADAPRRQRVRGGAAAARCDRGRRRDDGGSGAAARPWRRPQPACARGWPSARRRAWRPWRGRTSAWLRPAGLAASCRGCRRSEVVRVPFRPRRLRWSWSGSFLGHADRRQRIQNGLALYFQFPCQIVDSNFAHPSLFASLRP